MKKIMTIAAFVSLVFGLGACGLPSKSRSIKGDQQIVAKYPVKRITRTTFDRIQVGSAVNGDGGTSFDSLMTLAGKPASISTADVPGGVVKATQFTWTNLDKNFNASKIQVQVIGSKVVGKKYLPKLSKDSKITYPIKIMSMQIGTPYSKVIQDVGIPDGDSVTGARLSQIKKLIYLTGKDDSAILISFNSNVLTTKTPMNVKNESHYF
mgnify:CR=1 FL=1